jgi:hypothetical protein
LLISSNAAKFEGEIQEVGRRIVGIDVVVENCPGSAPLRQILD